jgi:hypothetical protein
MTSSQGTPFLSIHSADEHHTIYPFPNTTSYCTIYAFFSSFRITLWPMWLANSKRQPCFYPSQSHTRRHTELTKKKLTNLMGNLCCAREHSVQFFVQFFFYAVKLHSLTRVYGARYVSNEFLSLWNETPVMWRRTVWYPSAELHGVISRKILAIFLPHLSFRSSFVGFIRIASHLQFEKLYRCIEPSTVYGHSTGCRIFRGNAFITNVSEMPFRVSSFFPEAAMHKNRHKYLITFSCSS